MFTYAMSLKPFTVKFGEGYALIIATFYVEGKWIKRSLKVDSADSLWEGLEALSRIEALPPEAKAEAIAMIAKAKEREFLELAVPAWLLAGNVIKILAPVKGKMRMEIEEKDAIIAALGELGL